MGPGVSYLLNSKGRILGVGAKSAGVDLKKQTKSEFIHTNTLTQKVKRGKKFLMEVREASKKETLSNLLNFWVDR